MGRYGYRTVTRLLLVALVLSGLTAAGFWGNSEGAESMPGSSAIPPSVVVSGQPSPGQETINQSGASTNLLENPGFEDGSVAWIEAAGPYVIITDDQPVPAHSGTWLAWFGGYDDAFQVLYQDFTIPASATGAYVQFWYYIETYETSGQNDIMAVEIRSAGDVLLKTLVTFSNLNSTGGWVQSARYDITEYKGQTLRLRFVATCNDTGLTSFYVDDVVLQGVQGCDFNNDGKTDLVWRNKNDGMSLVWYLNGVGVTGYALLPTVSDTNWEIVGVGDFNSDGMPDLVWRHKTNGMSLVWYLKGVGVIGYALLPTVSDASWEIVGAGDFNSDGKADLLWRNKSDGMSLVWYLNGVGVTGYAFLPTVSDTNWEMVAP